MLIITDTLNPGTLSMGLKDIERAYKRVRRYTKLFGLAGGAAGVRGCMGAGPKTLLLDPGGLMRPVRIRLPSSDAEVYKQVFLDKEYGIDSAVAPKVIVDAGANCGLTSVFYSSLFPEATILAIEPEKENFGLLLKNISGHKNIIPIQAALWNHTGSVMIHDPGEGAWSFRAQAQADGDPVGAGETIRAVTIESIMDEYGIDRINLLKMDIEGSEKEVLEHSASWIERVDTLVVELHERFKPGCTRSFYDATGGFGHEWHLNEHVWVSRASADGWISPSGC